MNARALLRPGRRGRLLALLAVVAVLVVVAVILTSSGPGAGQGHGTGARTLAGSTTVQRRNLIEHDTESGTLSYSDPQTVYNRLSGTITWLPQVGDVVKQGGTLFKVDGEPVVLLHGTTPAYRALSSADSDGADIEQLNRDLIALGFNAGAIVADDVWQPATTDGVELFQESLGETATGSLTLGQVVFLPTDQIISTVEGTLGSTEASTLATPQTEFVSLVTSGSPTSGSSSPGSTGTGSKSPSTQPPAKRKKRHGKHTAQSEIAALTALLKAESQQLRAATAELNAQHGANSPSSPSGSGSPNSSNNNGNNNHNAGNNGSSNPGSGGGSATAVLQTTSTQLVVTVDLAAGTQTEAPVGSHVRVEMPAGNTIEGTVASVSSVAQSSSDNDNNDGGAGNTGSGNNGNSGSGSTVPVTIKLHDRHPGSDLDQAAVSVNFVEQEARNVLSVPVTALLAQPGGGYAVQEAAAPYTLIHVSTGLFAAGYVQISGAGVYPGLSVTDSQG